MKSNYKTIDELVEQVDIKNINGTVKHLLGVSINKCFINSVANVIGTDLTKYKIIQKNEFAVSLMQVSRDSKIPIACLKDYEKAIMSPAYSIFKVRNKNEVLPDYLSLWFMRSEFDREASYIAVGGVRGSMSWKEFCRIKVYVPPIEKQKNIVKTYNTISDRIKLKQKINDNLEQQAQAIFKSWFVDFEPFGNSMPKTWHLEKLGAIATIRTNSFSPIKNPDVMLEHYSIPAFDEQKYPLFESAKDVKSNKYILTPNSVMVSKLNPNIKRVWRPMCLSELAVSSKEFIIYEANNIAYRDFIYSVIDSSAFSGWMCSHTTGSTNSRQRTTPNATLEFEIPLADNEIISRFCDIVTPMYDTISQNIIEIQKLAKLRECILPKLMSGELDVSNLDL